MALRITGKVISLLASEIYEKNFEALHKKERQEFEAKQKAVKLTKDEEKLCKIIETSTKALDKALEVSRKYNENYINATQLLLNHKKDSLVVPTSKYPTQNQLEKDITLAMLDATSVDELVKKIKEKYKI